jgi:hypothetical protein
LTMDSHLLIYIAEDICIFYTISVNQGHGKLYVTNAVISIYLGWLGGIIVFHLFDHVKPFS